jgi:hypothetical protein
MAAGPGPNITVMKHYNAVIWCTGWDSNYTLLDPDREHLSYYLTRSNFSEANFLGETRFNAWIVGQGILDDLGGSGINIVPPATSFIHQFLKVNEYTTVNPRMPLYLDGIYRDNLTHGLSYPMIRATGDYPDTISPVNNGKGIFWHDAGHTRYNALRFNDSIHNLIFMPWVFSLINDTTTAKYDNESYKDELCYLIMHWFSYPDYRYEVKTSKIDIKLSNYDPVLGGSYVVKTNVFNLGMNDTNIIVRFLDGDTIINTKSIFVPANGNSSTEVIWSPLYAGYRNIRINIDPDNDIPEVFDNLNNNATWSNQLVYFFYDDMENGTGNWQHDNTIVRINGESPLEFIENPVYSKINHTWDYSMSDGFVLNQSIYHSYGSSFFTLEPVGINKKPLDIVLVVDNSNLMTANLNALKKALLNFVNSSILDPRDRVAIYVFKDEQPLRLHNFTVCNASGKMSLIDAIINLNTSGFPAVWDTIGEAVNYSLYYGSTRIPVVVALTSGDDFGAGVNPAWGPEDGSENYAPWHDWIENIWGQIRYHNLDNTSGHDHYGKYRGLWGWQDLDDAGRNEYRYGLLNNSLVDIYTIGFGSGIEHDNNSGNSSIRFPYGWMGEYAQYENGLNLTGNMYNESGTTEFNLWRLANTSGGKYYYGSTPNDLNDIYQTILQDVIEEVELERTARSRALPRAPRASIFSDDFESGDFTGGPWTATLGWTVDTTSPYAGTYYARARGNIRASITQTRNIDLTDYYDTKLSFYQYTLNVETTDFMYVDVSQDGGTLWTNVRTWDGQTLETGNYRQYVINLSAYDGQPRVRLRFRVVMDQNVETWLIDNIGLNGNRTGGGPGGPPTPTLEDLYLAGDRNLTTYPFSLEKVSSAKLSFYHKYNMRTALNGVVVMVGTPADPLAVNWSFEYIRPTQPYTGNFLITEKRYDDYGNEMRWCWNGVSGNGKYTWDFVEVDLTNWTGFNQLRIKVAFLWAGPGDGGAYFIDDFRIKVTRNDSLSLSNESVDQWELTNNHGHSGNHCWWNHNASTNHLSGGLDNSLYSRPIDLTNARNATLSAYFKFNINTASGRPPDGFRVEISSDNGVTWKAINMGIRSAWGVSTNGSDSDDGVPGDGKSYSGLDRYGDDTQRDGWVEANTLTRLNTDISGWAGSVITLRFRVVTASNDNPYYGGRHYQWRTPTNNAYGLMIDDVIVYGFSLLN